MQPTQNQARHPRRRRGPEGAPHGPRGAGRRLRLRLQLLMWRRRRERGAFWNFRRKSRTGRGIRSGPRTQRKLSENSQNRRTNPLDPEGPAHALPLPSPGQNRVTNAPSPAPPQTLSSPRARETFGPCCERAEPSKRSHTVGPPPRTGGEAGEGGPGATSGQRSGVTPGQDQAAEGGHGGGRKPSPLADRQDLSRRIHDFLDEFCRKYGSLIPLNLSDVWRHLRSDLNQASGDRKDLILSEICRYRRARAQKPAPSFQVLYKKHTLTLDDLSTLANQNWLNDQIMNMYGELIVDSAHHKVHFLNSFFHRQLLTKGYEGVKRWTKQVDLFSKSLLLVPIHLEIHWSLVTADFVKKKICLYDSQGIAFKKVARNILRYLTTEAKEKQRAAFENGWTVTFNDSVPQQTNENDCGVFVLEYSRRLALSKPLRFSQADIPKIRKRIYKELCACKLYEEG